MLLGCGENGSTDRMGGTDGVDADFGRAVVTDFGEGDGSSEAVGDGAAVGGDGRGVALGSGG